MGRFSSLLMRNYIILWWISHKLGEITAQKPQIERFLLPTYHQFCHEISHFGHFFINLCPNLPQKWQICGNLRHFMAKSRENSWCIGFQNFSDFMEIYRFMANLSRISRIFREIWHILRTFCQKLAQNHEKLPIFGQFQRFLDVYKPFRNSRISAKIAENVPYFSKNGTFLADLWEIMPILGIISWK